MTANFILYNGLNTNIKKKKKKFFIDLFIIRRFLTLYCFDAALHQSLKQYAIDHLPHYLLQFYFARLVK